MTDESPLNAEITAAAAQPASTSVAGTTVTQRPLTELIEADKHLNGAQSLRKPRFGLLTRKIARGSALGE